MRDTSMIAYQQIQFSGAINRQQAMIINYLRGIRKAVTRRYIASEIEMDLSAVCGRVNELIKLRVLVEHPRVKCSISGKQAHPVMINPEY